MTEVVTASAKWGSLDIFLNFTLQTLITAMRPSFLLFLPCRRTCMLLLCGLLCHHLNGQVSISAQIQAIQVQLDQVEDERDVLQAQLVELKLAEIRETLAKLGPVAPLEGVQQVDHTAMVLGFDPEYKMARWVAHILTPDAGSGNLGRTNDFRVDEKVQGGTALEGDYFTRIKHSDGSTFYDGFGFDRGHLAPSADFRWSAVAISESYFYSNMSPQHPDFNRISWATLEDLFRSYVEKYDDSWLLVITGPVLTPDLPRIEKGVHQLVIPAWHYKIGVDLKHGRAIGFLMPNQLADYPAEHYAVSIDSLESITGLNFLHLLDKEQQTELEAMHDPMPWVNAKSEGDMMPLVNADLPRNYYNTTLASKQVGNNKFVHVCGTVVDSRRSAKGNVFLNLDKKFPNQVFTVSIFSSFLHNFSYPPEVALKGQQICVRGKVSDFNGTPTMNIESEKAIEIMEIN